MAGGALPLRFCLFVSARAAAAGVTAIFAVAVSTHLLADAPPPSATPMVASSPNTTSTGATLPGATTSSVAASTLATTPAADAKVVPTSLDMLVNAAMSQSDRPVDSELECMAKAIHHEAANQPLKGQLAVGQVIRNRTQSGRFPKSFCAVVNQRGQFFSTSRYNAARDAHRWQTALAVARLAEQSDTPQVAPGALYFHAAYVRPLWSHHRQMVTQIGAHLFYR
jgi:spore germination cell wall hydrolase CwlJ-like protein